MQEELLKLIIGVALGFFALIIVLFFLLQKKFNTKKSKYLHGLTKTTKVNKFSFDIFLQKFYIFCTQVPFIKRYTLKIRRRLEIINLSDEYLTRKETAKIMFKTLPILFGSIFLVLFITGQNVILKCSLVILIIFFYETIIAGKVDKLDTKLLKDQINFFAEIRHAYHEFNMVEEAIYEVAQIDDLPQVSNQANKIYEILISEDPEMELEKYYDIAPNAFLKEFAGISYLTKEFGDRKDKNGASLYLQNLNNIVQEMQIEILKRDRIDYMFQSLSFIAMAPIFMIEPVKKTAMGLFGFTKQFYEGKLGLLMEIALIVITTICYIFIRKVKDESNTDNKVVSKSWQERVYENKYAKKFVDLFVPKKKTKERRIKQKMLKDSASKFQIEWFYVSKITYFIIAFVLMFSVIILAHKIQLNYIYTEPTADYDLLGNLGTVDMMKAKERTKKHNKIINKLKDKQNVSSAEISKEMVKSHDYDDLKEDKFKKEVKLIENKIKAVQSEYLKWFEILISFMLAFAAYNAPEMALKFKHKLRLLEMENEVMEYHTIILMLMKIERVNVEMMLEWIERYSNIFKDPLTKCVNNFESGPWEALEDLKKDVSFPQFVRIVESLQAAVEQIPIREAFDELETERQYYQERRKESNSQLIDKKVRIGKVIGFAPMIILFVGYLILPMVGIGMVSMQETFEEMMNQSNKI